MDLPEPRYGLTGVDFIDRGQTMALAQVITRQLAEEPDLTASALAATVEAARATLAAYPELDLIEACYKAGPDDLCEFCASGDLPHDGEAQEPPEWVLQAKAEREAAVLTLTAIAEAGTVQLAATEVGQQQTTGQWLADLYRSNPGEFWSTYQVLARDNSPKTSQEF